MNSETKGLTVAHVCYNSQIFKASESQDNPGFKTLLRVAALCNRSDRTSNDYGSALWKFAENNAAQTTEFRNNYKKLCEIPFKFENMYQLSVNAKDDSEVLLVMQGAPELILERCSTFLIDGEARQLDDDLKIAFMENYQKFGELGEHALGLCDFLLPSADYPSGFEFNTDNPNFPVTGLCFVGLISFVDRPPPAALSKAAAKCRLTDTQIVMITGDHPITAKTIAKSVGIISEGSETVEDIAMRTGVCDIREVNPALVCENDARACVLHGKDLEDMTDEQKEDLFTLHREIVFARASPDQKRAIIEDCLRREKIIGVYCPDVTGPVIGVF